MGNSAAGRLTATYFGTAATVLGAAGGTESRTLTAAQLPASIPYTDPGHLHTQSYVGFTGAQAGGGGAAAAASPTNTGTSVTGITINPGGGAAHPTASPMMLATIYLKL